MRIFRGHTDRVRGVTYSPDGSTLASCGEDGHVRTWSLSTGRLIRRIAACESPGSYSQTIHDVAFSADGRWMAAACGDKQVRVWSGQQPEAVVLQGHARVVTSVAFVDETVLLSSAGNDRGEVGIWRNLDNFERQIIPIPPAGIWSLAIHPTGSLVALGTTAESDAVLFWDRETNELTTVRLPGRMVRSVAFSPDGRWLAQSNAGGLASVWDLDENREHFQLRGHAGRIRSVAFSPDGSSLGTASDDGTVRLWDLDSGVERACFDWEMGRLGCVAFSPDGMTIAGGGDRDVVVWDVET